MDRLPSLNRRPAPLAVSSTQAPQAAAPEAERRQGQSRKASMGWSVGLKLAMGFGVLAVCVLAVCVLGVVSWLAGQTTSRQAHVLVQDFLPLERMVRDWKTQSVLMGQIALRATISTDVFPLVAEMRTQQEKDAARVKGVEQALAQPSVPDSVREAARAAAQQREAYGLLRD